MKKIVVLLNLHFQFSCSPSLKITKEKTEEFKQELSIFAESFNMHGPGAVGDDLEKGKPPSVLEPCLQLLYSKNVEVWC